MSLIYIMLYSLNFLRLYNRVKFSFNASWSTTWMQKKKNRNPVTR